jgi:hypothetical protein
MDDDERPTDPIIDLEQRRREERRPLDEAGEGESEGFELAEQELIDHASHGDYHAAEHIMRDVIDEDEPDAASYGEADSEHPND